MAVFCEKCGKEVDTLAKRRHRCRKKKPDIDLSGIQTVFLWKFAKPSSEFDHWTNHADLTQLGESS